MVLPIHIFIVKLMAQSIIFFRYECPCEKCYKTVILFNNCQKYIYGRSIFIIYFDQEVKILQNEK